MSYLLRLYRIINILSLDVVAGAVLSALYFARLFHVQIRPYGLAALGLTVWIIYTTDHLHDARKIGRKASSSRHRFHQDHFQTLIVLVAIALVLDGFMLFFIRTQVFIWGLWLIIFVGLYLLLHKRFSFLKEFFVGVMYTLGVLLLSLAVTKETIGWGAMGLIMQFFLLALLNLLIFSWYDSENDSKDQLSSFVTHFGRSFTEQAIRILFFVLFSLNVAQFIVSHAYRYTAIMTGMTVVLFIIYVFPRAFGRNDFYRMLGDSVFMLPGLILI